MSLHAVKAEILKTRKSSAFWFSLIGASFIPVIFFLILIFKHEKNVTYFKKAPWDMYIMQAWQGVSIFLLPMFVILLCSLICQIEFKNNTWKQVYASPLSYGEIFFSKLAVILIMILLLFVAFNLLLLLSAVIPSLIYSDYTFLKVSPKWKLLLILNTKAYISVLGIVAIQYWLSLRLKNFIAPMGIGLAFLITALIGLSWEHIYKIPYAHPGLTLKWLNPKNSFRLENHEWNSILYFIGITTLAFIDIQFIKKEKG